MEVARRYLLLAAVLGSVASAVLVPVAQAQTPPPRAPTVGIRILDAPTSRADDPRARLYIVDHLQPGTTIKRRVEVSNETDSVQPVQLYPAAADITDGTFRFGDGRASNELTSWTRVEPASLQIPAKSKREATVTVAVPADASPGERYGVVWAELAAATRPGGGFTAVNRVGARMYLSVGEGGEPASDFAITAFEARRDAEGRPTVAATVSNTGGRALDLSGELRLTNGPAGLAAGPFAVTLGTTLGLGQTSPVLVSLDPAIPAGPWDAKIVLRSGTTQREASATITFPAAGGAPAAPVPAEAAGGGSGLLVVPLGVAAVVGLISTSTMALRISRKRRSPTL